MALRTDGNHRVSGSSFAWIEIALPPEHARNKAVVIGRVEVWRGGFRSNISVSASFVWRCLSGSTMRRSRARPTIGDSDYDEPVGAGANSDFPAGRFCSGARLLRSWHQTRAASPQCRSSNAHRLRWRVLATLAGFWRAPQAAISNLSRFTLVRSVPSIRIRRVSPSRRGECRSPSL